MDISFCKLRCKEVVNICDGKNLGNIIDIIIDTTCGKILGLIVPANNKNFFNFLKSNNDIFIPYNRICKIGKDTILVDIIMQQTCNCTQISTQQTDTKPNKINIQSLLNSIDKNEQK